MHFFQNFNILNIFYVGGGDFWTDTRMADNPKNLHQNFQNLHPQLHPLPLLYLDEK